MGGLATWSAVQQGEDLPWGQEASAGVLTWGGQRGGGGGFGNVGVNNSPILGWYKSPTNVHYLPFNSGCI